MFVPPPKTYHNPDSMRVLSSIDAVRHSDAVAIITDPGVRDAGLLEPITDALTVSKIYDTVEPNPSIETVRSISDAVESEDVAIGVGGGSVMDATKAGCALPAFGSFETLRSTAPEERSPHPAASVPRVLVPTTAGTGTETGYHAVLSDHGQNTKTSVGHPTLKAAATVLNPDLTASLPPFLTATTGFDVIAHAVEAYVATNASMLTDPYAKTAFDVAVGALPQAVRNPNSDSARKRMLTASYLAGIAMNNAWLGAIHAISHSIGGLYDTPHGHTNALLLPEVIIANARNSERARLRYSHLADDTNAPGEALASRMRTLRSTLGLDEELPNAPDEWDWNAIATGALADTNMDGNPASLSHDDIVSICRGALG